MTRTDRAIRLAAGVTVVALAVIAGAISYSHMHELAAGHGETGWRGHAFPLSVDGIEIVASLVLLAHRRARTNAGALPWVALVVGTFASLAANVAVAPVDWIGRAVAGWPAVALLVAVKLMSGLLDHADDSDIRHRSGTEIVPVPRAPGPRASRVRRPGSPGGSRAGSTAGSRAGSPMRDPVDDPRRLEADARSAWDVMIRDGGRLSQRSLADRLRADGFRIRNDRAGELLRMMRAESATDGALIGVGATRRSSVGGGGLHE